MFRYSVLWLLPSKWLMALVPDLKFRTFFGWDLSTSSLQMATPLQRRIDLINKNKQKQTNQQQQN